MKKIEVFDYDWINNNTSHHAYLISSVKNLLDEQDNIEEKLNSLQSSNQSNRVNQQCEVTINR